MEQQVKTIRIKEGEVWVSPIVEPKIPTGGLFTTVMFWPEYENWIKDAEAYNASFVEVENPDEMMGKLYLQGIRNFVAKVGDLTTLKDGYYPAPEGLTFTVVDCDVPHPVAGFTVYTKQVAVVTLSEPKEEKIDMGWIAHDDPKLKEKLDAQRNEIVKQRASKEAEKEEKPDFGEWIKSEHGIKCMVWPVTDPKYLENRLFWAFDAGRDRIWDQYMKQKQKNQELQQEITTLRAQVLHFQELASKYLGENRELTDQYNALGVKYDKELERWQERDVEQRARIAELEKMELQQKQQHKHSDSK